jgi:pyruvate dehydrogenase E2 component (dihydrolipoamide acetyltransferase)
MPEVSDDTGSARLTEWLVGESGDFVGAQSIATVETDSSFLSIEVSEAGVLVKSLVSPGQRVKPGSALALLAAPGEVVEDVEQLMVQLGLAVAPAAQVAGVHLSAVSGADPLAATTWPPHATVEEPVPTGEDEAATLRSEPDPAANDEQPAGDALPVVADAPTEDPVPAATSEDPAEDPVPVAVPIAGSGDRVLGWVDAVAEAVVAATLAGDPRPTPPPTSLRQVQLRALIRADRLLSVISTVDSVSLIGLAVKAVAVTCRKVPLQPDASTIAAVAVQRRSPSGTIAPVVHVANLMTASSLTSTVADLEARGRAGDPEPASILIVDLGEDGVAEGTMDATDTHPAVLVVGQVRGQAVLEEGVLVPAQVMSVTLSCDANRIEVATAARWFAELERLLEEPLRFLT